MIVGVIFLKSFITDTKQYEEGKVLLDNRNEIDLFEACLKTFGTRKQFTLAKLILLYSVITYLLNMDNISFDQFKRRFRVINNLVRNSGDEISDSENRDGGNRLPAILRQADSIIIEGKINNNLSANFNKNQLNEENEKIEWLENNETYAKELYKLEDHHLLFGQISIIGLEHIDLTARFYKLFECNWDKVDCALLATYDYRQQNQNKWRFQMGSRENNIAWEALFHKSTNVGYENTKKALVTLLSRTENINDGFLSDVADAYIKECKEKHLFDWRYYYIRYNEFRPGRYGIYCISQDQNAPDLIKNYEMIVLWAQKQLSSLAWQPFLKAIDENSWSKDDCGTKLISADYYVVCVETGYLVYKKDDPEKVVERFMVPQNENGVDKIDRIEKYKNDILEYLDA